MELVIVSVVAAAVAGVAVVGVEDADVVVPALPGVVDEPVAVLDCVVTPTAADDDDVVVAPAVAASRESADVVVSTELVVAVALTVGCIDCWKSVVA